jgi:hypothetical protein
VEREKDVLDGGSDLRKPDVPHHAFVRSHEPLPTDKINLISFGVAEVRQN